MGKKERKVALSYVNPICVELGCRSEAFNRCGKCGGKAVKTYHKIVPIKDFNYPTLLLTQKYDSHLQSRVSYEKGCVGPSHDWEENLSL